MATGRLSVTQHRHMLMTWVSYIWRPQPKVDRMCRKCFKRLQRDFQSSPRRRQIKPREDSRWGVKLPLHLREVAAAADHKPSIANEYQPSALQQQMSAEAARVE